MNKKELIKDIDSLIKNTKPDLGLDWSDLGRVLADEILHKANEPVRPGSLRSLMGEDKTDRVYKFPVK